MKDMPGNLGEAKYLSFKITHLRFILLAVLRAHYCLPSSDRATSREVEGGHRSRYYSCYPPFIPRSAAGTRFVSLSLCQMYALTWMCYLLKGIETPFQF